MGIRFSKGFQGQTKQTDRLWPIVKFLLRLHTNLTSTFVSDYFLDNHLVNKNMRKQKKFLSQFPKQCVSKIPKITSRVIWHLIGIFLFKMTMAGEQAVLSRLWGKTEQKSAPSADSDVQQTPGVKRRDDSVLKGPQAPPRLCSVMIKWLFLPLILEICLVLCSFCPDDHLNMTKSIILSTKNFVNFVKLHYAADVVWRAYMHVFILFDSKKESTVIACSWLS